MTLTGSTTVANYQTALRAVTYENTSEAPDTLDRTVTFTVNDGDVNSNQPTRDITVAASNDAPALANLEAPDVDYTEGDGAVALTSTITVSDVDDTNLGSATVQITSNYQNGEDVLDFTDTGSITGSFNSTSGTMTLSGADTLSNYQTALRAVTYENTSEAPDTSTRTVTFTVNDGDADSNQPTRNITVAASNDAPALANLEAADVDYTEGDGAAVITSAITVSDADDTNLGSATVQITGNYQNGEDVLAFTDQLGISGSFNSTTGTMALTGSTTVANYQTVLRAVTYENTSDDPDTSTRTVTFTVNDGDADSNQPTRNITVAASNDAPALANLEAADVDYTEGDGVVAITSAITVSDADDTNLDSATVQISGNYQNGEDVLAFTDQLGISGSFNSTSGTMALTGSTTVANYQTALRAVTYKNTSENPDTSTRTVTFTVNDGDAGSNQPTRNITVAASNDAPALANLEAADVDYIEGDGAAVITSAITVSDVDDTNLESATVQITANYQNGEDVLDFTDQLGISGSFNATAGTMTLTGSSTLANYQTALRAVTYENTSDDPDASTRTVTFTVNDGDADSNQPTRDITVAASNDAPALANLEAADVDYTEGDGMVAITSAITVSDADDTNLDSATVQITANYQNGEDVLDFTDTGSIAGSFNTSTGTLTLSGSDTLADYQTALRAVTYGNTSDDPDTPTRTVTFTVNDGDADSNQPTRDITVTASNDAPALANLEGTALAYTEGDAPTAMTAAITVSDVDDTNIDSATVQITANYQNGEDVLAFTDQLGISGSFNSTSGTMALTGSTTAANYQTALRAVTYENTSEDPATSTRAVTFTVNDGDADSNQPTRNITVAASNDAPALANLEAADVDYTEGDGAVALTSIITVSDTDDTNIESATVQITANYQNGEDFLDFIDQLGITGSFNATAGTMTLTGSSTLANYQTALRGVTYENTSEDPDTPTRTVTFTVNDGDADSNQSTRNITVTASNDAPALANLEAADVDYTEGDPATGVTSAITVSDADDTNIDSATVQITANYQNGEDVLDFTDTGSIAGSFNTSTGTLTLSGSDTLADYQTALRAVTYENTSDDPDTPTRTVTFTVNDGDADSNQPTRDITVTASNDAPALANLEGAHRAHGGGPETAKNFTHCCPQTDGIHAILGKLRCA